MMSKFSKKVTCKTAQVVIGSAIGLGIFCVGRKIANEAELLLSKKEEPTVEATSIKNLK